MIPKQCEKVLGISRIHRQTEASARTEAGVPIVFEARARISYNLKFDY